LTPKRGQIYVGSWDSITEPKNYINQALWSSEGTFVCRECKEQLELMAHFSCFEGHWVMFWEEIVEACVHLHKEVLYNRS
jgi:hypothetical protein